VRGGFNTEAKRHREEAGEEFTQRDQRYEGSRGRRGEESFTQRLRGAERRRWKDGRGDGIGEFGVEVLRMWNAGGGVVGLTRKVAVDA
jgi:hypothetical protein